MASSPGQVRRYGCHMLLPQVRAQGQRGMPDALVAVVGPGQPVWLGVDGGLTERAGRQVFSYPEPKHILLARYIADPPLESLTVPG